MKKIYSLLLIISMLSACLPCYAEGETISAFSEIKAGAVSEVNNLAVNNGVIGATYSGSWAKFSSLDFGQKGVGSLELKIGVPAQYAGAKMTFHIDSLDAGSFAELTVTSTGAFTTRTWQTAEILDNDITGVHDLYIRYYAAGTGDLENMRMREYSGDNASVPDSIAGTDSAEKFSVLYSLGIIDEDVTLWSKDKKITGSEFIMSALKLKNGDGSEADKLMSVCGIEPDKTITNEKAAQAVITLLNRDGVKKAEESFYYMTAALSGIKMSGKASDNVTSQTMLEILYSALDAEIMEPRGIEYDEGGAYVRYEARRDNTLLSHYRNIYTEEGTVTMDYLTGIDSVSNLQKGQLLIDKYLFTYGEDISTSGLLGYKVKFYYEQGEDENKLLYIAKLKASSNISVNQKDIVSYKNRVLTYDDEDGREKKKTIPKEAKIIYNGLAHPDYSDSLFDIKTGSIELIMNDDKVECVKINSGENYRLAKLYDNKLYFKNTSFSINLDDTNVEYDIVDKNNKPVDTATLSENNVLSVLTARDMNDSFTYYKIIVSRKAVSGSVNSTNSSDREVNVDGAEYRMAASVSESEFEAVTAGSSIKAYVDAYGDIAFIEGGKSTEAVGYLVNAYDNDDDESTYVKIFDENGEMKTYKAADKIKVDGESYDNKDVVSVLKPQGEMRNALVLFYVNSANVITRINFAAENSSADKSAGLYKYAEGNKRFKRSTRSWGGTSILSGDFKLFKIPEDKGDLESYFVGGQSFTDDESVDMICYNREKNKLEVTLGVMEYNASTSGYIPQSQDIYYVSDVCDAVNSSDEVAVRIEYYNGMGKTKGTVFVSEGCSSIARELKVGDGIRFVLNQNGEAAVLTRMFSVQDDEVYSGSESFNSEVQICHGKLFRTDNGKMQFKDGGEIFDYSSCAVYVYDKKKNRLELGSPNDVLDYTYGGEDAQTVYMYARISSVRSMVLVKE